MLQHNWPNEESRNIKEVESSAFGWNWQAGRQLFLKWFFVFPVEALLREHVWRFWLHQRPHSLECSPTYSDQTTKKTNGTFPKMVFLKCFVFFFRSGMSLPRIQPKKYLVNCRYINRYWIDSPTSISEHLFYLGSATVLTKETWPLDDSSFCVFWIRDSIFVLGMATKINLQYDNRPGKGL